MMLRFACLAAVVAIGTIWNHPAGPADLAGPAQVIDADSIVVDGREIRLEGVDAPEWKQACDRGGEKWYAGREATAWLRSRLAGRAVACVANGRDAYGRTLATCYADGADIGESLVRAGWAFAYVQYSSRYLAHEEAARAAGTGLWAAACVPPWDWRRGTR